MVLNQKAYDYFASLGEVSVNDGGTDKESIIKTIEGATIAVTSWGNEAIDEEVQALDYKIIEDGRKYVLVERK